MKKIIVALILLALCLGGCERYLETDTPTEPSPVELAAPINLALTVDAGAVTLTWEHNEPAAVSRFHLFSSDTANGDFILRDSTTSYSYTFTGLVNNRTHYFRVAGVGTNGVEGDMSTAVSAFVGPMSILIEDGREYTRSQTVQVRLNTNNTATHVMLSEDPLFTESDYEIFAATRQFQLSSGEGLKTIYARFLFSSGATSGELLSDDITLDLKAEISSVTYTPAGPFSTGDTVTFSLNAAELEGSASVQIAGGPTVTLYDDGASPDATANDGIYTGRLVIAPELTLTDARVTGSFTDQAGNSAGLISNQVLNIVGTPLPVQLISVAATSSYEIDLHWTESGSSDFDSYRIYRGASAGIDNSGQPLATENGQSTTSWTDTTVAASSTYYYRVYVYNGSGLSAGSDAMSGTTPANDPPDPVILAGVLVDTVRVRLSWSGSDALDFKSYRIYRDFSPMADTTDGTMIELISSRSTTSFVDYAPADTTYYYRVYVFDRQGAYSGSNSVSVSK